MIEKIAQRGVRFIEDNMHSSSSELHDIYQYGFEILISTMLNIVIILGIGLFLREFYPSVIFLLAFTPLRIYAGGYHADTYLKCNLMFASFGFILLLLYKWTAEYITMGICVTVSAVLLLLLIKYAPMMHKDKPFSERKRKKFRILSLVAGGVTSVFLIISCQYKYTIGIVILYAMIMVSVFMLMQIIKNNGGERL